MAAGESTPVTWRPITTEQAIEKYRSEMERVESPVLYFQPASVGSNNEGEEVSKHSLQFPDYSDQAIRLQSFKHWGGVLPAQELAEGGFYMIAWDVVKCFSCNVVIQDWEWSDNVDKHCKHNPNCPFLEQLLNNVMKSATLSFTSSSKGRNIPEDERIIFENSLLDDISVDPTSTPLDQHDPQLLPVFPTMESRDEVQSINSNNIDVIYPSLHIPISSSNQCWVISDAQLPVTSGHNASHDNPQQVIVMLPELLHNNVCSWGLWLHQPSTPVVYRIVDIMCNAQFLLCINFLTQQSYVCNYYICEPF